MKITGHGYGKFEATNGIDLITALFERGKKGEDGKFHPHWNFTVNGRTTTFWGGKDDAVAHVTDLLTKPIERPLTREQAEADMSEAGVVHGIVSVTVGELLACDADGFPDMLSRKLCEVPLTSPCYHVVAVLEDGETLAIRVSGKLQ